MNANYDDLPILFEAGEIQPEDVIVDVGAGKGRAINWLLSHHPRNRIIGIELDPQICSRAAHRLRNYPQVTIVCGDAIKLLPAEGTIFYMFNPFNEEVMIRFRDALLSARAGRTGRTRLIYYNAESLSVFSSHPRFQASMIDSPSPSLPSASIDLVEEDSR